MDNVSGPLPVCTLGAEISVAAAHLSRAENRSRHILAERAAEHSQTGSIPFDCFSSLVTKTSLKYAVDKKAVGITAK